MNSGPARGHSTATLYEAAAAVWRNNQTVPMPACVLDPDIAPAWSGARLAGRAYTVRGTGGDNLALHRAIYCTQPGDVLVADLQGSRHGHWGEILAVASQARGIAGLVIDGGVRDRDEMRSIAFPVFSRNNTVVGTIKHDRGELGTAVTVTGITIHTGDLVVADTDGIIAIPRGRVDGILDEADRRVAKEQQILAELCAGRTSLDLYQLDAGDLPEAGR